MPTKVKDDRSKSNRRMDRLDDMNTVEEWPGIRKLYTVAMIADVLRAPSAAVRHWRRSGLLRPVKQAGSLEWFDFQQLVVGRQLVRLHAAGLSLREIDAKLAGLADGGAAAAAHMAERIVADGRRLSIQQGDHLLGAGGQLQFTFYTDGLRPAGGGASASDDDPDGWISVPLAPPAGTAGGLTISLAMGTDVGAEDAATPPGREAVGESDDADIAEMLDLAADLEAAGELVEAAEALRAVLQAQGPTAQVAFMLAELLYRSGDLTAARERYYAAVELDADHLEARSSLGCVLAELGDHELALAALEGVLRQQPDYADAHWHMAGVLDEVGRVADARRHLQAFLELAPESPWATAAGERLASLTTDHGRR